MYVAVCTSPMNLIRCVVGPTLTLNYVLYFARRYAIILGGTYNVTCFPVKPSPCTSASANPAFVQMAPFLFFALLPLTIGKLRTLKHAAIMVVVD